MSTADSAPHATEHSGTYRALVADSKAGAGIYTFTDLPIAGLPDGDVTIEVDCSSANYKDMLAFDPGSKVVRQYPLVPGIDLAGTVRESSAAEVPVGTPVLAHGYRIGTGQDGGFAELARVPAEWVIPLNSLSPQQAMAIGTAGFTAAMSVMTIEEAGIRPQDGPVLVTGASGGVGICAVDMLSRLGFEVVASTGKDSTADLLRSMGATEVVGRVTGDPDERIRPLGKSTWSAAVDTVGGRTLATVLPTMAYGGVVAASGNAGGVDLSTTVLPFILRGVRLQGIDSVMMPIERRREVWKRIETDLMPSRLDQATHTIEIKDIATVLEAISAGTHIGRAVVKVKDGF
ncbi:putative YhdH/YhfP family quinone oxidoreductase [Brevibacterium sanguinis]|uniref:YhdH/YhfP family quinone oxidoreductase n=2 Tax=Brevibacterium TaxID=1696 RepID=A0ABX9GU46_9MICO|nr:MULTISPECIES: acryloyl-CoA reductase [Brevibacterium]RBP68099.1 putative YhdH/YhfP family quinone oxidoreductase [Brevibacterium sanguinis]RBP74484.1 putative YhdH/YhfP family quinone oxidoreductase [Brevibacterium celere]